jgi:hypothetical protein
MICSGNPAEFCGGPGAINIYQLSAPTPKAPRLYHLDGRHWVVTLILSLDERSRT